MPVKMVTRTLCDDGNQRWIIVYGYKFRLVLRLGVLKRTGFEMLRRPPFGGSFLIWPSLINQARTRGNDLRLEAGLIILLANTDLLEQVLPGHR